MGLVFGKTGAAEPAYDVILTRFNAATPYELRHYGKRFSAETTCSNDNSGFRLLARYIGVGSRPHNEGEVSIAMTVPVAKTGGTAIAMTVPVVTKHENAASSTDTSVKAMQFFLPAKFDDLSKIPKPTNPMVRIVEIAPAFGAVHRFSGYVNKEEQSQQRASDLVKQLADDGVSISEEEALRTFQLWQFHPPFATIPFLRRNEVWIELKEQQVEELRRRHATK